MKLRDFHGVTSVLVTHKLEDTFRMAYNMVVRDGNDIQMVRDTTGNKLKETELVMIREGEKVFEGNAEEFKKSDDPYIQEFMD
jgi:ABC-type transporter Mla maintaining outer membrane lipid asymmetry ATPase subunit MlaF